MVARPLILRTGGCLATANINCSEEVFANPIKHARQMFKLRPTVYCRFLYFLFSKVISLFCIPTIKFREL